MRIVVSWIAGITLGLLSGVSEAAVITTNGCTDTAANTAIGTAVSGDIVKVTTAGGGSGCVANWLNVSIPSTKWITLDGNGAIITRTTSSSGQAITMNVNANGTSRITGFGGIGSNQSLFGSNSLIGISGCSYANANSYWRVDHNTFSGASIVFVYVGCLGKGLIDHNTVPVSSANEVFHILGGSNGDWTTNTAPPTGYNAVYVEDNTFLGNGSGDKSLQANASYAVYRFNDVRAMAFDVHGNTAPRGFWWEIYNNTLRGAGGANNEPNFIVIRGGSGLIFNNNKVSSGGGHEGIDVYVDNTPFGCTYPVSQQPGRGQNDTLSPIYEFLQTGGIPLGLSNDECPGTVVQDRDVYTDQGGSQGVRKGTIGARPGTCATNQAYWATDEGGNWNPINGTANDGRLYKCTAPNTWQLYYTPAVYPHPLQTTAIAATCSNADITIAIAAASDGWLVQVPPGNCTWVGQVSSANKRITLQGAGDGNTAADTIITASDANNLLLTNNVGQTITVKNIRFLGVAADHGLVRLTGTVKDFRLTKLTFVWTSTGDSPDGAVQIAGTANGLIDHVTFAPTAACVAFRSAISVQADSDTAAYQRPSALGTANAVFIEDSVFTQNAYCGSTHAVWGQQGSVYVARHNSLTNWTFDVHGPCSWRGGREFEIYENDFIATSSIFSVCVLRGGTGVYHSNRITTNGNSVGNHRIRMQEVDDGTFCNAVVGGNCYACDNNSPWPNQLGRGQNQVLDPIYFWNNKKDNVQVSLVRQGGTSCACQNGHDIDFYSQQNRDWVENLNVTPKPGYVAYTYPHPLQGMAQATDTTPPAAPTNLRFVRAEDF